ncbi:MAG: PrsW family intramembrane metalloprotease [Bacteroidales bacterium]|nr:PrsW family intramembrane metalloprotease [Bacteroidales bacterium]
MLITTLLLVLSVLPVVILMIYIYRQDKYQKEPIKSLIKAFIGGMLAIPMDLLIVSLINKLWVGNTVFYMAFWEAGIPEELSKFIIFMALIWWDKNFDEYFDGIVYATFIGLGFACVENVMYVFDAASESLGSGLSTGVVRAILSVPGHFLFGVVMGYFLSLAKFKKEKRFGHLISGLLLAMLAHSLFDWMLMIASVLPIIGFVIYFVFLWADIKLWKLGLKYINKQQENSRLQAQEAVLNDLDYQIGEADKNYDSEYKQINWNAGDRH